MFSKPREILTLLYCITLSSSRENQRSAQEVAQAEEKDYDAPEQPERRKVSSALADEADKAECPDSPEEEAVEEAEFPDLPEEEEEAQASSSEG